MTGRGPVAAVLVGAAVLAGCRCVPYEPGVPLDDPALAEALRTAAADLYPPAARAIHRAILTAAGETYVLTGYVLAGADGSMRLAAMTDFGSTVFVVARWADGRATVERRLPAFRESWLIDGALRDAEAIYGRRPGAEAALQLRSDGAVALVAVLSDGTIEAFRFDPADRRLIGYVRACGGRCLYEIAYSDFSLVPGFNRPVPRTIHIVDHVLSYRVEVRVADLSPAGEGGAP